jgi:hypothetical protein
MGHFNEDEDVKEKGVRVPTPGADSLPGSKLTDG